MPASDVLKTMRGRDYDSGPPKGMDDAEGNETPRTIKLSDEEQKIFRDARPGDNLACEVHGSLDGDGMFRIMTVSPLGGGSYGGDEKEMAGQIAERVQPGMQGKMMP